MNERQNQSADSCAVVRDLLPLYIDGVCSGASAALVEAHLAACPACSRLAADLKKEEIEAAVGAEKTGVLARHRQAERRTAWRAGVIIAWLLMIPVVIAAVVALLGGADAGVPVVLAAAMALVVALTAVPMMAKQNRLAKAILAGMAAVVLIEIAVGAFYGSAIIDTVVGTIFGISLVFLPLAIRGMALPSVLADKKALVVIAWDTLWLYLTILAVSLSNGDLAGCREAVLAATLFVVPVWLVLAAVKLPRGGRLTKAGLVTGILSLWFALLGDLGRLIFEGRRGVFMARVDFGHWAGNQAFNANVALLVLIVGLLVGGLLLAAGRRRDR
jgi:predicted anti-sigma-YlaC factor YlaD